MRFPPGNNDLEPELPSEARDGRPAVHRRRIESIRGPAWFVLFVPSVRCREWKLWDGCGPVQRRRTRAQTISPRAYPKVNNSGLKDAA